MTQEKASYFINPAGAPKLTQMVGLETTILTGLHGEKMMMALNATLPGHTVPLHSHPHEQIGMVYAGKARLRIGDEERLVQKGDFYCIPANVPHSDTCIGDEPFVMLDIFYPVREDFIEKLKQSSFPAFVQCLPEADLPFAGLRGWLLESESGQILFNESDIEVSVPEHSHGDQWGVVIDGKIELTIGDQTRTYSRGDTYFIPAGIEHRARIYPGFRAVDYFADRGRHRPRSHGT